MVIKYGNELTKQDITDLCNFYFIDRNSKESEGEIKFLLSYRNKLYDAVEKVWQAYENDDENSLDEAKKHIVEVSVMIEQQFSQTNSKNVLKRIAFINNMQKEIECIHNSIMWLLHKYSSKAGAAAQDFEEHILKFLKRTATKSLKEHDLSEMLDISHLEQTEQLIKNLKNQFILYIDPKEVSFYDNYFLIGESLNRIEELNNQIKLLETNARCQDCLIDDCAVSHCHTFYQQVERENEIKTYQRVIDICSRKLKGEQIDEEKIEKANKYLKDEDIRQILNKLINIQPIETRNDRYKKIKVETLTAFPEIINANKVKENLTQMNIDEITIYYKNINLIATSLLLTRCDYSLSKGQNVYDEFQKWYLSEGRSLIKEQSFVGFMGDLVRRQNNLKIEKELKENI